MCANLLRKSGPKNFEINSRFKKYGLTKNPFPPIPGVNISSSDSRENGSIYLEELRSNEQKNFVKMFKTEDASDINRISLLMDYQTAKGRGIGKTAFLNHQRVSIMKDFGYELSGGNSVLFAIHVNPIPNGNYNTFWKVSKLIIETLIKQEIISFALCRLIALEGLLDSKILDLPEIEEDLLNTLGNNDWLEKHDVPIFTLDNDVRFVLSKLQIDPNLVENLVVWGRNPEGFLQHYFSKISDSYFRKDQSKLLFNDIVKLLNFAGFDKGIILFDELEKVVQPLKKNDRRTFVDSLRYYLYDDLNEHTKLSFFHCLLVIHPYLQEILLPHWDAAGMDRFVSIGGQLSENYTILFNPIEDKLAITLAQEYIKNFRIESEKIEDQIFPFTKEALKKAHEYEQGIPGRYLQLLHKAIEQGITNNWETISEVEIESLVGKKIVDQKETMELPEVNLQG